MIFVDTSAFLAYLDVSDQDHAPAVAAFDEFVFDGHPLSHNYVVLESVALIQRRGGARVASRFMTDIVPLLTMIWVDESLWPGRLGLAAWPQPAIVAGRSHELSGDEPALDPGRPRIRLGFCRSGLQASPLRCGRVALRGRHRTARWSTAVVP